MPKQTFEVAMRRLESIVHELERGDLSLDEALKKFQDGVKLSKFCSKKLDETEKKVTLLLKDEEGKVQAVPFAPEENEMGGGEATET
ncbi:MAG TPA: exodeoxyribonuclease VII small subunit [Desulfobacterales bacterium]|nr:exodeoxyribonuclease VII small subunit [Desulfobacterales bacterium]